MGGDGEEKVEKRYAVTRLKRKMLRGHCPAEENSGVIVEICCGVGGIEGAFAVFAAAAFHLGMTAQVIDQAVGHDFALRE